MTRNEKLWKLDGLTRKFWRWACVWDHINPDAPFIVFSTDNPWVGPCNRARALWVNVMKQPTKTGRTVGSG